MSVTPFSERIRQRVQHAEPLEQVPWFVHDKVKCYRFCDEIGVRRATVFQCQRSVDDLNFDALPDRFVLKPTTGHSSQAIYPIEAENNAESDGTITCTLESVEIHGKKRRSGYYSFCTKI